MAEIFEAGSIDQTVRVPPVPGSPARYANGSLLIASSPAPDGKRHATSRDALFRRAGFANQWRSLLRRVRGSRRLIAAARSDRSVPGLASRATLADLSRKPLVHLAFTCCPPSVLRRLLRSRAHCRSQTKYNPLIPLTGRSLSISRPWVHHSCAAGVTEGLDSSAHKSLMVSRRGYFL